MNDELHNKQKRNRPARSLDERVAKRPELAARLHGIVDMLEQAVAEGCSADEAEERVVEQIRQLGQELLGQWAEGTNERAQAQTPGQHPGAVKDGKKKE